MPNAGLGKRYLAFLSRRDAQVSRWIALSPEAQQQRGWPYWLALVGAHLGDTWLWGLVVALEWVRAGNIPGISKDSGNVASHGAPPTQPVAPQRSQLVRQWLIALLVALGANLLIKQIAKRPRPGTGDFLYGRGPDEYSFPSGHAMRLGVIVVWSDTLWPGRGWLVWPLALWIGWSRVRLGIHYVGDVVVGLGLGGVIGCSLLINRKEGKAR